jgi:hypothetical protein
MTILYTNDDPLPTVETMTETDDLFDPPDDRRPIYLTYKTKEAFVVKEERYWHDF